MKIFPYSLQELGVKTVDLGKQGENKVRQIEFDLREWVAEYPGASVALYISQPNTTVYLATTQMDNGVLKWPIIDTYTAVPGFGDAEIVLSGTDGERLKSATASIFVSDSLSDDVSGEAPDYMKPYLDQVAENAAKVEKALEEIKDISVQSGGMPTGGNQGQILAKRSAENYDTHWVDPPSGSGTGGGVADSVAWDNVTDKPSTYPPAAHTHPEYLGKNETAANATQLNGKDAKYYIQPRNLLDNSWWKIKKEIVNQRGNESYVNVGGYTIDRWKMSGAGTVTVSEGCITLESGGNYFDLKQVVANSELLVGKRMTAAVKRVNEDPLLLNFTFGTNAIGGISGDLEIIHWDSSNIYIRPYGSASVEWAALYEGTYTADNLPPYTPKGYAAELAACNVADTGCTDRTLINENTKYTVTGFPTNPTSASNTVFTTPADGIFYLFATRGEAAGNTLRVYVLKQSLEAVVQFNMPAFYPYAMCCFSIPVKRGMKIMVNTDTSTETWMICEQKFYY